MIVPFSDEQRRCALNLEQHYDAWMDASRARSALPYGMRWANRDGKDYLYEALDRKGNARSLGRRDAGTEDRYATYVETKEALTRRVDGSRSRLEETCRQYRALRLPMIPSKAAQILREADRRGLLGGSLVVIGTNCMPAYALEAGGRIEGAPDQTDDFDMAWTAREGDGSAIWPMLQAVDDTYVVNTEKSFQARNASAYEVEFLTAPSRAGGVHRTERPKPVPLPEQEWLLLGRPVSHAVVALDATPARLVVPDPRWFALQKLWMSGQSKRNPLKRPKDAKQGFALLDAVAAAMPQYPLDEEFESEIPDELRAIYEDWKSRTEARPAVATW